MRRLMINLALSLLPALAAAQLDIALPADFSDIQGTDGITYESYFENRSFPDPEQVVPLVFGGSLTLGNGSVDHEGPTYVEDNDFYPYVMDEENRGFLAMHPNPGRASAVAVAIPASGRYCLEGVFARANNFENAGDGVVVSIFVDFEADAPLFEATISSAHVVDANDVFAGTGVAPFLIAPTLTLGQTLRFVVFSGIPGATDGGFDVTALVTSVTSCGIFEDGFEAGDLSKWL